MRERKRERKRGGRQTEIESKYRIISGKYEKKLTFA